jgi:Arc/MetJ family transcription regulator
LICYQQCVPLFKFMCMRTNIEIDDQLMAKAQKLTNIKTKKIIVDNALRLYVTVENQKKLIDLWGKIEIDDKAYE